MDPRASALWVRFKANRLAYTLTILVTLAVGILIGTVISYGVKGKEGQSKASDATPLSVPAPQQLSNAFSQIAKQLEPSVVNINTESTIKNPHRRGRLRPGPDNPHVPDGGGDDDNPFQDFFDRFFGGQGGPDAGTIREKSLGSGVIVDGKGYIITNRHNTTLCIGMTNDLERRIGEHKHGEIKGFTQRYHLNRLVWFEHFRDVNDAIACEKSLKGWLRSRKNSLIEQTNPNWLDLSADWDEEPKSDSWPWDITKMARDSSLRSE